MHNQQKRIATIAGALLAGVCLSGCTGQTIQYSPDDFTQAERVIQQKEIQKIPSQDVHATYGYGNDPSVEKAYKRYLKTGRAESIRSQGFVTFPYDGHSHPVISCSPLYLCVVQLESGEKIQSINLGDNQNWGIGKPSLVGEGDDGSYQIALRPKSYGISTDLVVTTNRRAYNIGLVSVKGAHTHVASFYYPYETAEDFVKQAKALDDSPEQQAVVSETTQIDLSHVNFNYSLAGDYPAWRPDRVFDDGQKTYIQMPPIASRMQLPVLYLLRNHEQQLVNYRYKSPYYIVDGLFEHAVLVAGKGGDAIKVVIDNKNFG